MEQEEFDPKKMSGKEKIECAKGFRDISNEKCENSSTRISELSDEFTRLEVQIATLLFALASFLQGSFRNTETLGDFSSAGILMMKLTFAVSLFLLIASLLFGLIHIKRKEKFWAKILEERSARFVQWNNAVKKVVSFEESEAYHQGTNAGKGLVEYSPMWTWVLQTICLGIAIALLFVLSLVFLFS